MASGALRPTLAPLRYGLALALTVVIVNAIVSQRGDTILLRGFELPVLGQIDVTLEALAEGGILAMRILVALIVFAVWSACVDPDRILKAIRPYAARSALTATLISRLVPLAAADSMRLQEAASLRGPAASEAGRAAIARRLVAGALERSVDVAATLELRGFGLGGRATRVRNPRVPGERMMLLSGLADHGARRSPPGSPAPARSETYPLISGGFEPETLAFALLIPLLAALPFCSRRQIRRLRAEARRMSAGAGMNATVLGLSGFRYAYPGGRAAAVEDLTLTIEAGEFVVLAGRSGSGKSTLLRAACGLVPHFHGGTFGGEVVVDGRSTRDAGPAELAVNVGFVAQEPESQVVSTTVRAELELPLELRSRPAEQIARAVEEVALALGIEDLLDRTTDTLSGGELQRTAIAAALVTRPPLLLLDEPTSQLDPVAGDELIGLLRRLNEEWGVCVVLGEHRLERCLPAADRVLALEAGRLVFDGSPEDFGGFATASAPWLATPGMKMFELAGLPGRPRSVKEARRELAREGVGLEAPEPVTAADEPDRPAPRTGHPRAQRPRAAGRARPRHRTARGDRGRRPQRSAPASSSRSSGPTAPASRRCCALPPACSNRSMARSRHRPAARC